MHDRAPYAVVLIIAGVAIAIFSTPRSDRVRRAVRLFGLLYLGVAIVFATAFSLLQGESVVFTVVFVLLVGGAALVGVIYAQRHVGGLSEEFSTDHSGKGDQGEAVAKPQHLRRTRRLVGLMALLGIGAVLILWLDQPTLAPWALLGVIVMIASGLFLLHLVEAARTDRPGKPARRASSDGQ